MDSLQHTLQIGTLATWLSVVGFGTVAVVLPGHAVTESPRHQEFETQWIPQDITLGGEMSPAAPDEPPPAASEADPEESLPAPPDMPDDAQELEPLPEVPDPPPPATAESPPAPRPTPAPISVRHTPHPTAGNHTPTAGARSSAAGTGQAGGGSGGMSNGARIAAGSMPSPIYPAEARRLGQTGTLVVEFTVDGTGQVISAYAVSPSPWPLLNQEAVRTVRRWRFPPGGGVMKLQRPIVFQLR